MGRDERYTAVRQITMIALQNDRADEVDGMLFRHPPIVGNCPSFLLH
jgi:hypothetical protein